MAVDLEGRRQVLAVELANRESRSSWKDFLLGQKKRGLFEVEFVVSTIPGTLYLIGVPNVVNKIG